MSHLVDDNLADNIIRKPETTDMYVDLLADSSKLVSEEHRKYYEQDDEQLDDDMNDFLDKKPSKYESEKYDDKYDDYKDTKKDDKYDSRSENYASDADSSYSKHSRDSRDSRDSRNDSSESRQNSKPKEMTEEEIMLEKLEMIRKLAELVENGVKLTRPYSLKDDLKMMKYEYELHKSIRSKRNAIQWMNEALLLGIKGIEMGNSYYDPFGLKLDGWSDYVRNNSASNINDVLGELYEKYNVPGRGVAPELKLALILVGGAAGFHQMNSKMDSEPNLNSSLDQNPELLKEYRRKALLNKYNDEAEKYNEILDKQMNKEHLAASRKVADLQMLKEKELEFYKTQKLYEEQKAYLDQLKRGLASSPNERSYQQQAQQAHYAQQMRQQTQEMPLPQQSQNTTLQKPVISDELNMLLDTNKKYQYELERERQRNKMYQDHLQKTAAQLNEMQMKAEHTRQLYELAQLEKSKTKSKMISPKYPKIKLTQNISDEIEDETDNESQITTKSQRSINPKLNEIFQKKTPRNSRINGIQTLLKQKSATSSHQYASTNEKVITIESEDEENMDKISLGSKRSNRSSKK